MPDAKLCWRPGSSDNKEEGIWMKKGESRIWRRTGEREVATNKKKLETAKGGARQKNLSWILRLAFQKGLVYYSYMIKVKGSAHLRR